MAVGVSPVSATNPIPDAILAGLTAYPAPNSVLAAANRVTPAPAPAEETPRTAFNTSAPQTDYYATDKRERSQTEMVGWLWLMQSMNANLQTQGKSTEQLTPADMNALVDSGVKLLEDLGMPAETINSIRSTINEFGTNGLLSSLSSGNLNVGGRNINWQNGALLPTDFDTARALRIVGSDDAKVGYCALGTKNILRGMGYRSPSGNAEDWDEQLRNPRSGYTLLRGVNPRNAPEGALLFYDSDDGNGRAARNESGGKFGHVEVVGMGANGERLYLSSHVSRRAGGTVPDNFEGAYIYTGPGAPPQNLRIAAMFNGGTGAGPALNA